MNLKRILFDYYQNGTAGGKPARGIYDPGNNTPEHKYCVITGISIEWLPGSKKLIVGDGRFLCTKYSHLY